MVPTRWLRGVPRIAKVFAAALLLAGVAGSSRAQAPDSTRASHADTAVRPATRGHLDTDVLPASPKLGLGLTNWADSTVKALRRKKKKVDTLARIDSVAMAAAAIPAAAAPEGATAPSPRTSLNPHPYPEPGATLKPYLRPQFPTYRSTAYQAGIPKIDLSRDALFYVVLALLIWMGILKSSYEKYYNDLFTVFFRSSLRQHQIREQLVQATLPSLLYNLFFVGCAGTFLYLLAKEHDVNFWGSDWELWLGAIGSVALLYLAKFLTLKMSGWIFGMTGAVDTYIFIVFLVNKILGVALLPIVVLLAFSPAWAQSMAATLGVLLVAGMLIYRFIRSYRPVWEEVKMSQLHFFLYICAFEIAPLLLIYRTMLRLL